MPIVIYSTRLFKKKDCNRPKSSPVTFLDDGAVCKLISCTVISKKEKKNAHRMLSWQSIILVARKQVNKYTVRRNSTSVSKK